MPFEREKWIARRAEQRELPRRSTWQLMLLGSPTEHATRTIADYCFASRVKCTSSVPGPCTIMPKPTNGTTMSVSTFRSTFVT